MPNTNVERVRSVVGGPVRNAGLVAIEAPRSLAAGEEGSVDVVWTGEGGSPGDSVDFELPHK